MPFRFLVLHGGHPRETQCRPLDQGEEWEIVCRYLVDEMKARLKCAQSFEIEVYGKKVHKQACRSHNDAAPPRWVRSGTIGCRHDTRRAAGSHGGGGRGAPDHCDRVGPTLAAAKGKVPGGSPTEVDGCHLQGYSRRRGDPARAWTSRSIVVAERVSACPTV